MNALWKAGIRLWKQLYGAFIASPIGIASTRCGQHASRGRALGGGMRALAPPEGRPQQLPLYLNVTYVCAYLHHGTEAGQCYEVSEHCRRGHRCPCSYRDSHDIREGCGATLRDHCQQGCRATRDGSRCRHLGTYRRRSRQHHRRWRDAAGFAGRRQGIAAGPHRPQTTARHRHGDPAAGRARLRAAAERPGIGDWVTYIAKLYNEEFHLLARKDFTRVTDLANQKVNVDSRGTGTAITAARLFDLLRIPVTTTNDDQEVALEKLRKREIAALCFVSGKPAPIF